jgi:hypothetical protein
MAMSASLEEFYFTIGGFHQGYMTIELSEEGFKLHPRLIERNQFMPHSNAFTLAPTNEGIESFLKTLHRLNVLKWRKEYSNSEICDGTQWELVIKIDGRRRFISGSNAYPEGFEELQEAIRKLLGQEYVQYENQCLGYT